MAATSLKEDLANMIWPPKQAMMRGVPYFALHHDVFSEEGGQHRLRIRFVRMDHWWKSNVIDLSKFTWPPISNMIMDALRLNFQGKFSLRMHMQQPVYVLNTEPRANIPSDFYKRRVFLDVLPADCSARNAKLFAELVGDLLAYLLNQVVDKYETTWSDADRPCFYSKFVKDINMFVIFQTSCHSHASQLVRQQFVKHVTQNDGRDAPSLPNRARRT